MASKVCVLGGAGYIGSALVHSLLQNGYTVHATIRALGDESEVGLLKSFPYAEERLHLFEADVCKPEEFEKPIQGCVVVFHVAYPTVHEVCCLLQLQYAKIKHMYINHVLYIIIIRVGSYPR
ncbi:putative (3R)-2'-hydroxyisoflavanone reductase [Helianthus anomalus]